MLLKKKTKISKIKNAQNTYQKKVKRTLKSMYKEYTFLTKVIFQCHHVSQTMSQKRNKVPFFENCHISIEKLIFVQLCRLVENKMKYQYSTQKLFSLLDKNKNNNNNFI